MRNSFGVARWFTLVLALVLLAGASSPPAGAQIKHYVCPPCGLPCDSEVFDKPGTCPKCHMVLVDQEVLKAQAAARRKVGILIFEGVQIIDYTGPYEIFQAAGFNVYTIARTRDPITTDGGMTVVPRYALGEAPQPDILVVPGGGVAGALGDAATLRWVKEATAKAQRTLSVCNGAFILAKAGLLDGLTATTTHGNVPRLRAEYPRTKVVDDQRFVDNGKIITAGGLTAGIDGALHVVSVLAGKGKAQVVALEEEYDWRPNGGFVRGKLADANLWPWLEAALDANGTWEVVRTEGGLVRWELEAKGTSTHSAAELMDRLGEALSTEGNWTVARGSAVGPSAETTSSWRFTGRDAKPWMGTLTVRAASGGSGAYGIKLAIARRD